MKKIMLRAALVVISMTVGLQAAEIAFWDFEEAIDGQYGVESITQSVDSVSGFVAVEGSGNPLYIRGADGVGHGTGAGILKVAGDDSLLTGFTQFKISFDARLHATPSGTQFLSRYGVTKTAWSIYTTTDGSIRMEIYDNTGTRHSLYSAGSVMPAGDDQYHHYEFVWNGFQLFILLDGEVVGSTDLTIDSVQSTDGNGFLGIGGMVREAETTGYEFNGFIDNFKIEGSWDVKASGIVAWDFEEGAVGNDITQSVDSVNGLVAAPANSASPQYVSGNSGGVAAGFGGISGVLGVQDPGGVLGQQFTKLAVSFDVDLTESNTATTVLLRNGYNSIPFNIFVSSSSEIGVVLMDNDGVTTSGSVYTSGDSPALDPDAGWQSVSVVWDGSAIYISVDGELLKYQETSGIDALAAPDAPMGIGGLIRANGSIGQFLPGSIDNIQISGYAGAFDADADDDGLPDEWESTYFGGATNAVASADGDSDGYTNLEEYILGTHPLDANSRLEFSVAGAVGGMTVQVSTVSGRSYAVQYRELLTSGDWLPLTSFEGTGAAVDADDTSGASMRFYRILVDYAE